MTINIVMAVKYFFCCKTGSNPPYGKWRSRRGVGQLLCMCDRKTGLFCVHSLINGSTFNLPPRKIQKNKQKILEQIRPIPILFLYRFSIVLVRITCRVNLFRYGVITAKTFYLPETNIISLRNCC